MSVLFYYNLFVHAIAAAITVIARNRDFAWLLEVIADTP